MSSRSDNYKGSSRSTRDDSRLPKESRKEYERRRSRSRSRSPRRRDLTPTSKHSPTRSSKHSESNKPPNQERDRRRHEDKSDEMSPVEIDSSEEDVPAPPPPPRITPISIELAKPKAPIKMNLAGPPKSVAKKPLVASVFNNDDDDDEEVEEMPAEARMRMRNIGRETPTSAGPNSFGKTKQGFCDAKKVFEKNLKQALEPNEKPAAISKFPQTIYKIKGP